jgi:hypothetical protein
MSKITEEIPAQAYELIRDRIGAILAVEIAAQVTNYGDYEIDANVWVERWKPFSHTEVPAINVQLARGNYDGQHQGSADGTFTYHVDVYDGAKSTTATDGDKRAALKVQKLLGVCRYILQHTAYKTLDFAPPFIHRVTVTEFNIAQQGEQDSTNQSMARLTVTVKAGELTTLLSAIAIDSHYSTVKLSTTDKGFLYITNIV